MKTTLLIALFFNADGSVEWDYVTREPMTLRHCQQEQAEYQPLFEMAGGVLVCTKAANLKELMS